MTVKAILDLKGRDVATVKRNETLHNAAKMLTEYKIGAVVIVDEDGRIAGILSERDIVRVIARGEHDVLTKPVSEVMTKKVKICAEHNTINEVMEIMTRQRFRHMPVEVNGKLAGIVSIGDVVKWRMEEVEREAEEIRNYIATG